MNIISSIKTILNYLYNNLIDLVWTKKIRFADGSEMTTAGNSGSSLYDKKLLSQPVKNKGWAFTCFNTWKNLHKSQVPTLFEDIKQKFMGAELDSLSFTQMNGVPFGYNCGGFHGNYFYCVRRDTDNHWYIFRTTKNTMSSPVWEKVYNVNLVYIVNSEFNFYCTDKFIVTMGNKLTDSWKLEVLCIGYDGTLITSYTFDLGTNSVQFALSVVNDTNDQYVYISYGLSGGTEFYLKRIKVENNPQIEDITITESYITNIYKYNNYFYFIMFNRTNNQRLARCTNWSDINILCACSGSYGILGDTIITEKGASGDGQVSFDGGNTFEDITTAGITDYYRFTKFNGIDKYICQRSGGIYTTFDFINYDLISSTSTPAENFTFDENNEYIICMWQYDIYYSNVVLKVFQDTLIINGSTVTVNYVKYNDFKIININDSTSVTNANSFYNYLGYANYFVIDFSNEEVYLPRNNNLWSCMFVGDDYIDSTYPIGSYNELLKIADNIIIDTASITLDITKNTNYRFVNSDITDITFSSCQDSPLETVLDFSTGNTAPTLTDNSGISWVDGSAPVLNANKSYIIVIYNKKGFVREY